MQAAFPEGLTQFGWTMSYASIRGQTLTGNDIRIDPFISNLSIRHHFGQGFSTNFGLPLGTIAINSGDFDYYVSGFGDINLGFRQDLSAFWGRSKYTPRVALSLNIGLPSGTEASIGQMGTDLPPNLIAIGYNAFAVEGRLEFTQPITSDLAFKANAASKSPLTPSSGGFVYGQSASFGIGAVYFPGQELGVLAQLQGRYRAKSKERGTVETINSGGTNIKAGLGVFYRFSDSLSSGVQATTPIYLDLNGAQPEPQFSLLASVVLTFDKDGKHTHDWNDDEHGHFHVDGHIHGVNEEHDHNHGKAQKSAHKHAQESSKKHEDKRDQEDKKPCCPDDEKKPKPAKKAEEPCCPDDEKKPEESKTPSASGHGHRHKPSDTSEGDVSDFSLDGEDFVISEALVSNKITVIDFWAEWCAPCKVLTKNLAALASTNKDLAVRRVEVPSFDSPVGKKHLSGAKGLPILWIFNQQGKLVEKLESISPDKGLEAVKRVLETPSN